MAGSPSSSPHGGSPGGMKTAHEEVNQTMDVMRHNMNLLAEREERLNNLNDKSSTLQVGAAAFNRSSKKVRWQMEWQRYRMVLLIGVLVIWLIIAIVFYHRHQYKALIGVSILILAIVGVGHELLRRHFSARVNNADPSGLLATPGGSPIM
mmetsp:Transcript_22979/g.42275  ORF Transcript_22979/g.42275 Transcript_22979/m.42275 type:complete len:151 (+) Transcript_22979:87-539(+)